MRRAPVVALLVVALAGLVITAVAGSRAPRPQVLDLGVVAAGPVYVLERGQTGCQEPVGLSDEVERVAFTLGPFTAPRGPFTVSIRERSESGRVLASASVPRGELPSGPTDVALDRPVSGNREIAICVQNRGQDGLELIGDVDSSPAVIPPKVFVDQANRPEINPTRTTDQLVVDGRPAPGYDLAITLPRAEPSNALAQIPDAFRHAAQFKLSGMGAWTYWVLVGLVVVLSPVLLVRALRSTLRDDDR